MEEQRKKAVAEYRANRALPKEEHAKLPAHGLCPLCGAFTFFNYHPDIFGECYMDLARWPEHRTNKRIRGPSRTYFKKEEQFVTVDVEKEIEQLVEE